MEEAILEVEKSKKKKSEESGDKGQATNAKKQNDADSNEDNQQEITAAVDKGDDDEAGFDSVDSD